LLSFISFFNPQGIPKLILYDYDNSLMDKADRDTECNKFKDNLDLFLGYLLVSIIAGGIYKIHALVQVCTRL
jgi:hypothetical protein